MLVGAGAARPEGRGQLAPGRMAEVICVRDPAAPRTLAQRRPLCGEEGKVQGPPLAEIGSGREAVVIAALPAGCLGDQGQSDWQSTPLLLPLQEEIS